MRKQRVRFTRPKPPQTVKKVREGVTQCVWSPAGRAELKSRLGQQWKDQGGICPKCEKRMMLLDCKFEMKEFVEGEINRVIHKGVCP